MILITPLWLEALWWGEVAAMLLFPPILPPRPTLRQELTQEVHELQLVTWRLCWGQSKELGWNLKWISGSPRLSCKWNYESAWRPWTSWCQVHRVESVHSTDVELVHYLWHLFSERQLAMATLGVHQAAICSVAFPSGSDMDSSNMLYQFFKAAFLLHPPVRSSFSMTWDVWAFLDHLASSGPVTDLDLKHLIWRTFALILLFSCRRTSHLSLMGVDHANWFLV